MGECGLVVNGLTCSVGLEDHADSSRLWVRRRTVPPEYEYLVAPSEECIRLERAARLLLALDASAESDLKTDGVAYSGRIENSQHIATQHIVLKGENSSAFSIGDLIRPLVLPFGMAEPLYPYQSEGVNWLLGKSSALLADDMGLGKSLQAIAAIRRLVRTGGISQAIVVCPGTLVPNWTNEFNRWAPELAVAVMTPSLHCREMSWKRIRGRAHVVITSYDHIRSVPSALKSIRLDLLVLDEIHKARKLESQITNAVRSIASDRIWALSGTPMERSPEDFAVIMSIVDPMRFSPTDDALNVSQLRARSRPFILRRMKSDVLSELPAVERLTHEVVLSVEQEKCYKSLRQQFFSGEFNGPFIELFNRLISICDIEPITKESAKIDFAMELIREIVQVNEKSIVFSHLLEPLEALKHRLRSDLRIQADVLSGVADTEVRKSIVSRFRTSVDRPVLLASSRIASEGLSLVEANHVIFINRWWNPSQIRQAEDRVMRIGQHRPVFVHSITTKKTMEAAVTRILERKSGTFEKLMQTLSSEDTDLRTELIKSLTDD